MKKFKLMLAVTMLFFSAQIYAQNQNRDPEQMAQRQTERMKVRLDLSEDQATKVGEINKKLSEKMQAARTSGELNANTRQEFRKKQMEERDTEFKKILTEEQWTKWEVLKKERENRGRRPGDGNGKRRQQQQGS